MSRGNTLLFRAALFASISLAAVSISGSAHAQSKNFDIPAQSAETGVASFAQQADVQVLISAKDAAGKKTKEVHGGHDAREALTFLLAGTGLSATETGPQTYTVVSVTRPSQPVRAEQGTSPAVAPDDPPPPEEMGQITVTARKREETLLNVPIIVTPISRDQLESRQTGDLKDVAKFVPGLLLGQTLGASGTQVSLRGVGTSAINAGVDASVALNLDGMQITQGIAYASAVFDMAQTEILKGPQSLFYGKNSPGGVISIHSADPTDKFELVGGYGYEVEGAENRAQFIISGPVSDTLKLRLAAQYDSLGGYFTNDAVATPGLGGLNPADRSLPDSQSYIVRGTAIWQPSDQFDAHLKVNLTNDHTTGGVGLEYVSCPDGTGAIPPRNIPFMGGTSCQKGNVVNVVDLDPNAFKGLLNNNGTLFNDTNQKFGTLELNYRPQPDITLTSVTGFYRVIFKSQQNGTDLTDAGPGLASIVDPITRREVTEELRANSDFSGPVNFTAGGFYENGKLLNRISLPGNTDIGLPASLGNYEEDVSINSTSAFGQARWKVIQNVEIDGGARWTHETRDLYAATLINGAYVTFPTAVPRISSDNVSPDVTVSYKPTEDITAFASFKEGYKSGSFSLTALTGADPDLAFGDEKVEGEEYGVKAQMLDRRLFMDTAFYDYHYKGLQVGVTEPVLAGGVPVNRTLNAAGALIYGIDYDVSYLPPEVDGLKLQGAVEWNHARFKTLNNVPCWGGQTIAEGCNQEFNSATQLYTGQNMSGQPLLRAPDWQVNFGFSYERPVGNDLTLAFSNTNQYSSRYLYDLGLRPDFYQSAFFKTDLTMALKGPRDRWEFALIGKNLSNVLTSGSCQNGNTANGTILGGEITGGTGRGPAGVDEVACFMDRGREIWLRVTVRPFN